MPPHPHTHHTQTHISLTSPWPCSVDRTPYSLHGICGIQFRCKLLRFHHWIQEVNLIMICLFRSHTYGEGWVSSVWGSRKDWSPSLLRASSTYLLQVQSLLQVNQDVKLSFSPTLKNCHFICEGRRKKSIDKTEKFSLIIHQGECQREREIQFARSGGNA